MSVVISNIFSLVRFILCLPTALLLCVLSVYCHLTVSHSWMCGNIQWGYSPAEARQVTAIASFHHPHGYAWGYIRFVSHLS